MGNKELKCVWGDFKWWMNRKYYVDGECGEATTLWNEHFSLMTATHALLLFSISLHSS